MSINEITTHRLSCGTWRVADVRAVRISAKRSSQASLRIFHTPSMSEAWHIAQMWAANDYSREPGRFQTFDPPTPKEKAPP